jgi:hypothetical protein
MRNSWVVILALGLQSCLPNDNSRSSVVSIQELTTQGLQERCEKAEVLYSDLTRTFVEAESLTYFLETGEQCHVEIES